jgi:arabinogalactan endo-1,4-beta-galactosidase
MAARHPARRASVSDPLWRSAWFGAFLLGLVGLVGAARGGEVQPWLAGADVSALATFERHGAIYRDGRTAGDALAILRARGVDCFRLRLFVAPSGVGVETNDLAYTVALAQRVKRSGAMLLLDLHYSDTWADPAKQTKPAAWADQPLPQLAATVRGYTADALRAFAAAGAAPDYVQLGNEITNGLLWPEGRVEFAQRDDAAAWDRLGTLLRAAHDGLADACADGPRPRTILHLESPQQLERLLWFCRQAAAQRVPFDLIGVSYYPDWHGGLAGLRAALGALAAEFRKPVLVAETAYPSRKDEHWNGRPHLSWPLTPAGQRRFVREVTQVVAEVPDGLGAGVLYWHPEAVPVAGLAVWVGGSCGLFDRKGRVLPAAGELVHPGR